MPDEEIPQPTPGTPGVTPPAPATPPEPKPVVRGHGGTEIPEERVSEIKARERRKLLKELYGTEDEDQAAVIRADREKKIKRAEEFEAEQEKARLANLSELDRLKEELRIEREQRAAEKTRLEGQLTGTKTELEVERQDMLISGIGQKHIAPKFLKTAKVEFGEYVDGLTKGQLAELDQKKIDKWFRDYAKENPEFAPKASATPKTAEETEADEKARKAAAAAASKRVTIGAPRGALQRRTPAVTPASTVAGKGTFKGKKVKDLDRKELAEYKKSLGMKPGW